jgi:hypothetical protein
MHLHPDLVTSSALRCYQDFLAEGDDTRRARVLLALARAKDTSRTRPSLGLIEGTVR